MAKIIKETIHAKGIDIGIYTTNFENEFISQILHTPDFNRVQFEAVRNEAG